MPGDEGTADDRYANSSPEGLDEVRSEKSLEFMDAQRPSPSNPPSGEPSPDTPSGGSQGDGPVNQVRELFVNVDKSDAVELQNDSPSTSDRSESPDDQ